MRSSGVFPTAEFWATPNFYINATPIFVNNALQSFDYAGTVATVGYQHVTDKWITSLYALKPFYKESSELVQSALKAQTGLNVTALNKILNVTGGVDVKFSDNTDFGATAGVDHLIRFEKNQNVFIIDPSFYAFAGTQQFQQTYYKRNNTGLLNLPGNNREVTENVQKFNILAYELSVPLIYAKNKLMLIATPAYVIPQNLITIPNRPDLSERGENMFYTTLTAKYTF
jgi:hypothetical protein